VGSGHRRRCRSARAARLLSTFGEVVPPKTVEGHGIYRGASKPPRIQRGARPQLLRAELSWRPRQSRYLARWPSSSLASRKLSSSPPTLAANAKARAVGHPLQFELPLSNWLHHHCREARQVLVSRRPRGCNRALRSRTLFTWQLRERRGAGGARKGHSGLRSTGRRVQRATAPRIGGLRLVAPAVYSRPAQRPRVQGAAPDTAVRVHVRKCTWHVVITYRMIHTRRPSAFQTGLVTRLQELARSSLWVVIPST